MMHKSTKRILIKVHWFFSEQLGIDPLRFWKALLSIRLFISEYRKFRKSFSGILNIQPCFHDRNIEGGDSKSEYFWQDLLVSQWVYKDSPIKHVDIASRIDGFVAHVASFRTIEVADIRPVSSTIPGVIFRQLDIMDGDSLPNAEGGYCDSLSCLHALEHFGLGRYGDTLDPEGYKLGIQNLASLLVDGGSLYLSTPIGLERVEFNANWVFDPRRIIALAAMQKLKIKKLVVISDGSVLEVEPDDLTLTKLAENHYNLGIFVFEKNSSTSV